MRSDFFLIRMRMAAAMLLLCGLASEASALEGDAFCFRLYADTGAIPGTSQCPFLASTAIGGPGGYFCTGSSGVARINRYCGMTYKNAGPPNCEGVGNPVHAGTGNKFQSEVDFSGEGAYPLRFERFYNYMDGDGIGEIIGGNAIFLMGRQWRHTYARTIRLIDDNAYVERPDGKIWVYWPDNNEWVTWPDVVDRLRSITDGKGQITGWVLRTEDDLVEYYDAGGRLVEIQFANGRSHLLAYDANGLLESVTDALTGRALQLTYTNNQITSLTTPDGEVYNYSYDGEDLLSVTYPSSGTRTYHYNEPSLTSGADLDAALTGITDERGIRFAEFEYDADGRAIATRYAGGVNEYALDYSGSGTEVTEPLGAVVDKLFTNIHGNELCTSWTRTPGAQDPSDSRGTSYDSQGNAVAATDYNGNRRCSAFDTGRNLEAARLEGVAPNDSCPADIAGHTPTDVERKISRQWHPDWRMETARAEPLKITRRVYHGQPDPSQGGAAADCAPAGATVDGDPIAVLCARIEQATDDATGGDGFAATPVGNSRIWRYTYNADGQVLSEDGPRTDVSDVTTYSYYGTTDESGCDTGGACHRQGDLHTIADALGHVTEFVRYDRAGRVVEIEDVNDVATILSYHPRGWLADHSIDGATTSYTYLPTGHVERITQPDGVFLDFEYDDAQRLEAIENALGERIEYTLDDAGNRTAERIYDDQSTLTFELQRAYDQLGRLQTVTNGTGDETDYEFDAAGNLFEVTDALSNATGHAYDPLNRLKTTLDALNGDTGFEYDGRDNVAEVTDAEGLNTLYSYNGFDELTELDSPDTGVTTYTYDSAGNRLTQTDARGVTTTYTYDALNRLTAIEYPDSSLDVAYFYDEADSVTGCANSSPTGRMTRMTDESGETVYCYDARGNVTLKQWPGSSTNWTIEYGYNTADRMTRVTYPSGRLILYTYDSAGQVTGIRTGTSPFLTGPLVTSIEHLPFGPVRQYTLGPGSSGQVLERAYDLAYRVTDVDSPALSLHFRHDPVGNIDRLGTAPGAASPIEDYVYDDLYRLEAVQDDQAADIEAYTYDLIGNRQSKTRGSTTWLYDYAIDSHRLTTVGGNTRSYDAVGNLIADQVSSRSYTYGDHNRLTDFSRNNGLYSGTYTYNGRGERVRKYSNAPDGGSDSLGEQASLPTTTWFIYDESGHLLAERSVTQLSPPDNLFRGYAYLGDIPVAILRPNGDVYYIHADHLGTPRAVTDTDEIVRWEWDFEDNPFGQKQPDEHDEVTGYPFKLNLRFPGQYYDSESGLHYNYFRDYEPSVGRYIQSDPIGLDDGASTYRYVNQDPLNSIDKLGLFPGSDWHWAAAEGERRRREAENYVRNHPTMCKIRCWLPDYTAAAEVGGIRAVGKFLGATAKYFAGRAAFVYGFYSGLVCTGECQNPRICSDD